jgi:hypothetical protein
VSVDTFSFGKYTLKGELAGFGKPVPFKSSISVYPWGLLLVAIGLLQLGLLYFRDRARNRLAEDEPVDATATVGAATLPVAPPWRVAKHRRGTEEFGGRRRPHWPRQPPHAVTRGSCANGRQPPPRLSPWRRQTRRHTRRDSPRGSRPPRPGAVGSATTAKTRPPRRQ